MITDMLKFTIREGTIAEAAEVMRRQMKDNLRDEGCLISKVFQSKTNPNEIYMLLCWENQAAIDKHLATSHDAEFRKSLDPLLSGTPAFFEWDEI